MARFAGIQYHIHADKVDGSRKWPDLLKFSIIYMLTYLVGWSEKVQTYADVIYGWYLVVLSRKDSRSTLVNSSIRSFAEFVRFLFCIEALMARLSSANV